MSQLSIRMCSARSLSRLLGPFPPNLKSQSLLSMRLVLISRLELIIVSPVPACRYNHWPLLWKFGQLPNQGEAHQPTTPAEYRVSHSRHRHQVWFPSKTHHSPPMDRTQLGITSLLLAKLSDHRFQGKEQPKNYTFVYVTLWQKHSKCLCILSRVSNNKIFYFSTIFIVMGKNEEKILM